MKFLSTSAHRCLIFLLATDSKPPMCAGPEVGDIVVQRRQQKKAVAAAEGLGLGAVRAFRKPMDAAQTAQKCPETRFRIPRLWILYVGET